jgi:hypothetical protein
MKEKHHVQVDDWENNVAQAPTLKVSECKR